MKPKRPSLEIRYLLDQKDMDRIHHLIVLLQNAIHEVIDEKHFVLPDCPDPYGPAQTDLIEERALIREGRNRKKALDPTPTEAPGENPGDF